MCPRTAFFDLGGRLVTWCSATTCRSQRAVSSTTSTAPRLCPSPAPLTTPWRSFWHSNRRSCLQGAAAEHVVHGVSLAVTEGMVLRSTELIGTEKILAQIDSDRLLHIFSQSIFTQRQLTRA